MIRPSSRAGSSAEFYLACARNVGPSSEDFTTIQAVDLRQKICNYLTVNQKNTAAVTRTRTLGHCNLCIPVQMQSLAKAETVRSCLYLKSISEAAAEERRHWWITAGLTAWTFVQVSTSQKLFKSKICLSHNCRLLLLSQKSHNYGKKTKKKHWICYKSENPRKAAVLRMMCIVAEPWRGAAQQLNSRALRLTWASVHLCDLVESNLQRKVKCLWSEHVLILRECNEESMTC